MKILLYNDVVDTLTDEDDIGAIDTEPDEGEYQRKAVSLDSGEINLSQTVQGVFESEFEVTFDVRNVSGEVDSWAAVVNFQSDIVNAESQANDHLLATASLEQGLVSLAANDSIFVNGKIQQA